MKTYPKTSKQRPGHFYFGDYDQINLGLSYAYEEKVGPFEDRLHYHKTGQEYYWVMQGEGILEVEGKQVKLTPDQLLMVETGEKHHITQVTQAPFAVAVICTVKSEEDKVIV